MRHPMMQTTIESLHWRQRWRQLSVDRMGWRSNSSQVLTTFRTSYVKYFEQFNRRGPHHLHLPDSHRLPKLLRCSCAMIDNSMLCVTLTHSYLFGLVQLAQCQTCTFCDIQTCYHGDCNINARSADWSICIRVVVRGLYKDRQPCFVQDGTIATCNCHVLHLRFRYGLLPKCVGMFPFLIWGSFAPCLFYPELKHPVCFMCSIGTLQLLVQSTTVFSLIYVNNRPFIFFLEKVAPFKYSHFWMEKNMP